MQTSMPPPIPVKLDWNTSQKKTTYLKEDIMKKSSNLLNNNIIEDLDKITALNSLINSSEINKINIKSFKNQPFKEDIIIRNCDSGKSKINFLHNAKFF